MGTAILYDFSFCTLVEMWSDWRLSGTAGRGESHGGRQPSRSGRTRLQPAGGGKEESAL